MSSFLWLRRPRGVAKRGCYQAACFVTRPCLCPCTPGTLQALARASVDLLAEDLALLTRHATEEASRSHAAKVGAHSQAVKDTVGSIRDDPRRRHRARAQLAARRMRAARETQNPTPSLSRSNAEPAQAPPATGVRRCRGTGSATGLASPTVGAGSQAVQDTIGSIPDGAHRLERRRGQGRERRVGTTVLISPSGTWLARSAYRDPSTVAARVSRYTASTR